MQKKTQLKITAIKDNIVTVEGKHPFQFLEEILFNKMIRGIVLKANHLKAQVALLKVDDRASLKVGEIAIATGELFTIDIFNDFFGSVIDIYGEKVITNTNSTDSKIKSEKIGLKHIFEEAKPIYARKAVVQPLCSGTTAIDGLLPIGRGQKELIIGDRGTGKTGICVTMMIAQKGTNIKNIYVAIGKKREEIIEIRKVLQQRGVLEQTLIVATAPDDTAAAKYLAPYIGVSIAEFFQEHDEDVLVILDDLSNHADAYRELSLLIGVAPGREAFPGDIFFTHSRLLERGGRYTKDFGGGSITIIPVVQTLSGDISGYIPTNLISITDGQIYTSSLIFNEGRRPAIEITYSVSRLGSAVQSQSMIKSSIGLKRLISEYEQMKKLSSFNVNLSAEYINKKILGQAFELIIDQKEYEVVDYDTSVLMLLLLRKGYLSFYNTSTPEQLTFIKEILKVFLSKDILGMKLAKILNEKEANEEIIELYLHHLILPLLKYHILSENKWLRKNPYFNKVFQNIRNDGRVLLSYERRGYEKGIAYEI